MPPLNPSLWGRMPLLWTSLQGENTLASFSTTTRSSAGGGTSSASSVMAIPPSGTPHQAPRWIWVRGAPPVPCHWGSITPAPCWTTTPSSAGDSTMRAHWEPARGRIIWGTVLTRADKLPARWATTCRWWICTDGRNDDQKHEKIAQGEALSVSLGNHTFTV